MPRGLPAAPPLVSADVFLGLAAVLLVTFVALSAGLREIVSVTAGAAPMLAAPPGPVAEVRAEGLWLHAPGRPPVAVPQSALPDAEALRAWAAGLGSAPLVVVAADAGDTDFLAEAGLARAGVPEILRLRLPPGCTAPVLTAAGYVCGPAAP